MSRDSDAARKNCAQLSCDLRAACGRLVCILRRDLRRRPDFNNLPAAGL